MDGYLILDDIKKHFSERNFSYEKEYISPIVLFLHSPVFINLLYSFLLVNSIHSSIMQIRLLKILALLGSGDKQASENMYTVVGDIFRKCDSSSNIGNAVLYECICCVSSIYANPKLIESAADVIARFLKVCS